MVYVLMQFLAISALLYFTSFTVMSWSFVVQVIAISLAAWAGWELQKSRLSVLPELKEGAQLIQRGPYRLIRHPMYSSLLLFFIPTALNSGGIAAPLMYLLLLVTLLFKVRYEEKLLNSHFSDYENYSQNSYSLVPFIF